MVQKRAQQQMLLAIYIYYKKVEKMCWYNMLKLFKTLVGHVIVVVVCTVKTPKDNADI